MTLSYGRRSRRKPCTRERCNEPAQYDPAPHYHFVSPHDFTTVAAALLWQPNGGIMYISYSLWLYILQWSTPPLDRPTCGGRRRRFRCPKMRARRIHRDCTADDCNCNEQPKESPEDRNAQNHTYWEYRPTARQPMLANARPLLGTPRCENLVGRL